jgi:hypothetical protein
VGEDLAIGIACFTTPPPLTGDQTHTHLVWMVLRSCARRQMICLIHSTYLRNRIFLKNTALANVLTAVIPTMAYPSALHLLFTKELIRLCLSYPKVEAYMEP